MEISGFEVLRIREDGLDRLFADVLQGVLEVAVGIEPVDDRLADYREQPDGMPDASLAARFLENLPGDDEGLDAPLGQVVRELEMRVAGSSRARHENDTHHRINSTKKAPRRGAISIKMEINARNDTNGTLCP